MTGYFALALQFPDVFLAPDFAGFMGMVLLGFGLLYLRTKVLGLFPQPKKERKRQDPGRKDQSQELTRSLARRAEPYTEKTTKATQARQRKARKVRGNRRRR